VIGGKKGAIIWNRGRAICFTAHTTVGAQRANDHCLGCCLERSWKSLNHRNFHVESICNYNNSLLRRRFMYDWKKNLSLRTLYNFWSHNKCALCMMATITSKMLVNICIDDRARPWEGLNHDAMIQLV
jgi:hypothetical protein